MSDQPLQEAMDETFFLSNMAPQVGAGFNRQCERYNGLHGLN
jgi:DNA/RNA endonuclease G (NUC1)